MPRACKDEQLNGPLFGTARTDRESVSPWGQAVQIGTRHFACAMMRNSRGEIRHNEWLTNREAGNGRVAPARTPEDGRETKRWRSCRTQPHVHEIPQKGATEHQISGSSRRGLPPTSNEFSVGDNPTHTLPNQINSGERRCRKRTPEDRTHFCPRPVQAEPAAITLQWQNCLHPWQEMQGAAGRTAAIPKTEPPQMEVMHV